MTWQWQEATAVDNSASDLVNNDTAISCVLAGGGGMLNASYNATGCVQQPAVSYSSRWIVGFPQIDSVNKPGYFSIFANSTSLVTNLFGTLADALMSVISPTAPTTTQSARYAQFAKLAGGDIVAVFWLETAGGANREVYANVYSAATRTWGTAAGLSTAAATTDFGSDGLASGANRAVLCRPQVAASGDGSAVAVWCEGASPSSTVKFSKYSSGSWSAAAAVAGDTSLFFPGFTAYSLSLSDYDSDADGSLNGSAYSFAAGDIFRFSFAMGGTAYTATVTATSGTPATSQFLVATSGSTTLYCQTMSNLVNAILASTVTVGSVSRSISSLGFSMALDPSCSESNASLRNITVYFNKPLAEKYWDSTVGDADNVVLDDTVLNVNKTPSFAGYGKFATNGATNPFNNAAPADYNATKSATVAVAGDGYGNYAMARSVVSPLFQGAGITSAYVSYGRLLAGHEYNGGSASWQTTTGSALLTKKISPVPACYDAGASPSADYVACSARSPKFVMSDAGKGLVFFHQNQPLSYSATAATGRNPNRLWVAAYSVGTGFASGAGVLDEDTFCNSSSPENDVPVCETGSYAKPCQTLAETLSLTSGLQRVYPDAADLDHDVPPIAARMNANGNAIVAFHKKANSGTITSPSCAYYGVYARLYDPASGFGSLKQLDEGLGDTMHAQAAINAGGTAAVVWEEVRGSSIFLIAREYLNGSWQTAKTLVEATASATDSMMPAVEINDSGEVLVSFSYGLGSVARRQYVRRLVFQ